MINDLDQKERTKELLDAALTLPDRRNFDNSISQLPRELCSFLVDAEFINDFKVWEGSWGMKYSKLEKAVYMNDRPMPREVYNHYCFRLGVNSRGKPLFPAEGNEYGQYSILHEVNHAYQDLMMTVESGSVNQYYEDLKNNRFGSTAFSKLIEQCLLIRMTKPSGITTWGNQPSYNGIENIDNNLITRSIEDANELVTMAMWHPDYLSIYLNYLSGDIPGYTKAQVLADGLQIISPAEKTFLQNIINEYIQTMRRVIRNR